MTWLLSRYGRLAAGTAWAITALTYLAAVALAELLVTFAEPRVGMAFHCLVLVVLLVDTYRVEEPAKRGFLLSLAFAPLIRILSLSLPLSRFAVVNWYLLTSIPLFAAALVAARILGHSWKEMGLKLRGWPLQLAIGLTGLAFGALEYLILRPKALSPSLSWSDAWWPALILLVCTGLLEEMIFRGLLQRTAEAALPRWGMTYVAVLFAVLHIGYRSVVDVVFVLAVGLFFGRIVQRTRSLLGVTLAHGVTNIVLFLVMPFLLGPR